MQLIKSSKMPLPDKKEALRALIVESDVLWADAHATVLKANDCSVTIVANVDEALELMQRCYYHIVILETQENEIPKTIYHNQWFEYMVVCVCSERVMAYESFTYWLSDNRATGMSLDNVLYFSKGDYYPSKFWERIQSELIQKGLYGRLTIDRTEYIEDLSYQMTNNLIEHIESSRPHNRLHEQDTWVKSLYVDNNDYEALRQRVEYEIYDLLRRCINAPKVKTIQLVAINGGLSKAAVLGITPKIEGRWTKTYILKLGYHKEIQDESDAYDNHVRFNLERGPKADTGPKTPALEQHHV